MKDLSSLDAAHIAGVFKSPGKSLMKQTGPGLGGDALYMFPDGTYVYTQWSDVSPETISDKGTWTYSQDVVQLVSDPEVKWNPGIDRRLIAFRRTSVLGEVLLIEVSRLPDFEEKGRNNPESLLLIVSKERSKTFQASEVPKLKASLMKNLWNPGLHSKP